MFAKRPVTMLVLLAWLLLSLDGSSMINCATIPDNSTDVLSLQDFKHEISGDPTRVLDSWNSTISHCMWQGVRCSLAHPGRVVALELPSLNLVGQISPSIGNLTFLKTLNLSANILSGQLPPFNHLQRLQILDLSSNSLHDNIPDTLANCSYLRGLHLRKNNLFGEIPPKLGFLSNLSVLNISYNNLTGSIPPSLGNITRIDTISIATNMLTGSIPDELAKLANISMLFLGDNRLSGKFPRALYNLSSLENLGLEINDLGGRLPNNIGDLLPNLQWLLLNQNKFEGHIPASLGNASGIYRLDLNNNNFTAIPSSFGKLQNLMSLNVESNNIKANDSQSWEFFDALTNCSSLQLLSLSRNQLHGAIPNSVGKLSTSLQKLLLSANQLSGLVPPGIGNLRNLIQLSLDNNHHLSGSIEEWIGNLTDLQHLSLQYNNFTGPIPSSIGNITKLTQLILIHNKFEGPIPPSVGKLLLLQNFYFAYNNFQGEIPQEISQLNQLIEINLSSNKLTGEIPNTLNHCPDLVRIMMDNNFLMGAIPDSIGNIPGLSILNLSHNNLTGGIPAALSGLQLAALDLSYNNLQGEVNGIFSNDTAVSLEGNLGLCGGATNLHMPSCKTTVSKNFKRRNYLIKVLIPVFGFLSLVLLVYFLLSEKKMRIRKYLEMPSYGDNFLKVTYNDLAQATANFSESNLIGRGSYGTVYRGKLKETKFDVAVKVFDLDMRGAEKSFLSECEALRSIQHRNLLPIITACSTVDITGNVFKALLYEFMPNGSLDSWLHSKRDGKTTKHLGLTQRLSIAVNIADALNYLHHDCGRPTVHCDLKPSNILLDDDMTALLGDFGIARFYVDASSTTTASTSSIGVKGTIGYIAPEYAHGGQISISGDVYSFGIVLLEIMTGKRPTDPMFNDGLDIVSFVESNTHQMLHVIDANLSEECKDLSQGNKQHESAVYQCLAALLQVALSSTRPLPSQRMNMKEIASRMQAIKSSYIGSKSHKHGSSLE